VPQPRRLQKTFVAWIRHCAGDRGEFKTVGCRESLIRPHRFLQLPPLLFGEFQHLLPPGGKHLAARTISLECRQSLSQRRDGRGKFLGVGLHVSRRLRARRAAWLGIVSLGNLRQKSHRSCLPKQIKML